MTDELETLRDQVATLQEEVNRLDMELKAALKKYVPVSSQRLDKVWVAVRETMDVFSLQLADEQEFRRLQNEKIATLNNELRDMKQQVVLLSVLVQSGKPVERS